MTGTPPGSSSPLRRRAYGQFAFGFTTLNVIGGIMERLVKDTQHTVRMQASSSREQERLALLQGVFYITTGIWPIVHMKSFEAVSGPKVDKWLVRTAGVLITSIGVSLMFAGLKKRVTPEVKLLAVTSALGLTGIDVVYVSKRRISKIYLLDAATEIALVAAWGLSAGDPPYSSGVEQSPRPESNVSPDVDTNRHL